MQLSKRQLGKLIRDERGSQLTEFALSAMVFFAVMLGFIDVCRAMYAYHYATYAAQQGARYAIVRGATWSSSSVHSCATSAPPNFNLSFQCTASAADVQNYVRNLPGVNANNMTVTTTWPGTTPSCAGSCSTCSTTNNLGCMVKVQVDYKFQFIVPFLPKTPISFTATSVKTIQQ